MPDTPSAGGEPTSSNPELVKRVEVFMGERPPSPNMVPTPKPVATPSPVETPMAPVAVNPESTPQAKRSVKLDDEATDKAVEAISVADSDIVLTASDKKTFEDSVVTDKKAGSVGGIKGILRNRWVWIGVGSLLLLLFIIPATRYTILGLFIHKTVSITVIDSKTHTPVSGAYVVLHGKTNHTDATGVAKIKVPLGSTKLTVTKLYFKDYESTYFVGLISSKTAAQVSLVATGRQVPVVVLDKITHRPISGAEIRALNTTAKTDTQGKATIVLPTTNDTVSATVSISGYNTLNTSLTVTATLVTDNTLYMVPSGKVYFLSNQSGKIDVVKTNLDGSDRQVVIAGTGKEDPNSTSLLASRDWQFLVLKAQRDTSQPALYLIDTSNDKITNFDSGDASFNLIGWYDHKFMYDVVRNTVPNYQNGHEVIKSYSADNAQLNQLDQNQAEGTATSYADQSFSNFYIISDLLTYNTQWYSYSAGGTYNLSGKTNTIRTVGPNTQVKKDVQTFDATGFGYFQAALYEPQSAYYAVYSNADSKTTYYNYNNQSVTSVTNIDQSTFNKAYPTYLLSPGGKQTFWSDFRDGKNTLFIGDSNAKNGKQVASETDYAPYGWFTDNYVLVSKNNSELYIVSSAGLPSGQQPMKISNYYKPNQTYNGYGYGYGGL